MKAASRLVLLFVAPVLLYACANWLTPPVQPGQSEADVIAALGKPTHVYQHGGARVLEYMHGPMGQTTDMARFGPDGKLIAYEQALTTQNFKAIKVGEDRKDDVLRRVGAPSEIRTFSRNHLEAWFYPYKEDNAWDSMMAVYFDDTGVVRKLDNGPDPRRMGNDNPKD